MAKRGATAATGPSVAARPCSSRGLRPAATLRMTYSGGRHAWLEVSDPSGQTTCKLNRRRTRNVILSAAASPGLDSHERLGGDRRILSRRSDSGVRSAAAPGDRAGGGEAGG